MSEAIQTVRVTLPNFEGPLDLLLYLIKKNDLNVYDIRINVILDQYTDYIELLKELNIDLAGEFLVMASELAHIKSKLLLNQKEGEEKEEGEDPRAGLVARLIEYQKYKRAAAWLNAQPKLNTHYFKRADISALLLEALRRETDDMLQVEPMVLVRVFQEILKKVPTDKAHEVMSERVSVTQRIYELLDVLAQKEEVSFESLFSLESPRIDWVVTFLSILEMAKLKMIRVRQAESMGTIWVTRSMEINQTAGELLGVENYANRQPDE